MHECCQNSDNLVDEPQDRKDLEVLVCKECGARHLTITVDPGKLGALGAPVG